LKAFFSGASLVVHKHSGGLAKAIATQVIRYEIVQRCKLNSDGCLLWQNLTLLERQMRCKALAQDQIYIERVRLFEMCQFFFSKLASLQIWNSQEHQQ
jgi:hypothetical protein